MENVKTSNSFLSNIGYGPIRYIKPGVDTLINTDNQQCSIEAIKFSANNFKPTYRLFGMPDNLFVPLEALFGNSLEYQQHTIDTLELTIVNANVANSVGIQDDSLFFSIGSYVQMKNATEVEHLYVQELTISYAGVDYTLLDSYGSLYTNIPAGVIVAARDENIQPELYLFSKKESVVYTVQNETISDVEEATAVNNDMPEEVREMIKTLEGKTPEEAMAIIAQQQTPTIEVQAEAVEVEKAFIPAGIDVEVK